MPRLQSLLDTVDDPTRLRYLLALAELPTTQSQQGFNPADYAPADVSAEQQQTALLVAQHYDESAAHRLADRLATDEQRPRAVRTAAIRVLADQLIITRTDQIVTLMRLSADEDATIAAAAHQALQQRRNSDSILAHYGVGATGRAVERGWLDLSL